MNLFLEPQVIYHMSGRSSIAASLQICLKNSLGVQDRDFRTDAKILEKGSV